MSLLYHFLWLPVVLAAACALKRFAFDTKTIAIVLAGLGLVYAFLYGSTTADFPVDIEWHKDYIRFIDEHHRLPKGSEDGVYTSHHLPTYYLLATAFYKIANVLQLTDPSQFVRHLSVMFYAGYLVLVALVLRKILTPPTPTLPHKGGGSMLLALAMLAFWPIGVVIASRIHLDVFSYIGQMLLLYWLTAWVMDRKQEQLANAFVGVGVLLLARGFGMFFLILCVAFLLYALYKSIAKFDRRMVLSIAFALVCYTVSALHRKMMPDTEFLGARGAYTWVDYFFTFFYFNPWQFMTESVLSPMEGANRDYFWHFYFRSAILGDFIDWKGWMLAFPLGVVWLAIIIYTLATLGLRFKNTTQVERRALLVPVLLLAMMSGLLASARYVLMHIPNIGDVRYFMPITVIWTLLFAFSLQLNMRTGHTTLARAGNGLALSFIMLSIGLIAMQVVPF